MRSALLPIAPDVAPESRIDFTTGMQVKPVAHLLIDVASARGRKLLKGALSYIRRNTNWQVHAIEPGVRSVASLGPCRKGGFGVIAQIDDATLAAALRDCQAPVVNVGSWEATSDIPRVGNDVRETADLALEHFCKMGYRHVAFIGAKESPTSRELSEQFAACALRRDVDCRTYQTDIAPTAGSYAKLIEQLRNFPKPIGVLAGSAQLGRKLIRSCMSEGIVVPHQVAVVGFSDSTLLCELADPPMTSVAPHTARVGYVAANILDRMLQGETEIPQSTRIRPQGVAARKSTDAYAVDDPDVAAAARFIRENALSGIKVTDVLKAVPMSRRVLESRFRDYLGRTPHQEILNVRLDYVKHMLQET
ncbi:MAG: substrate-binding domain-containing protein, partial [Planctomycetota bacterium]